MGYERSFIIILRDCAVHRWNSPSSALRALLSVFNFDDFQSLEGAFTSLLSIVLPQLNSYCFALLVGVLWCLTSSTILGWGEGKKALNLGFICRPRTTLRQRFGALSCQRFWRREICILLCKYFQRKILNDKWNWHQMHYESRDNVQWKSRRLLVAVVSLSFCLVETNCSQARRSSFGCVERGKYYAAILKELGCFIWYVNFEQALRNPQILEFKFPVLCGFGVPAYRKKFLEK